jgi:hypothetical protein
MLDNEPQKNAAPTRVAAVEPADESVKLPAVRPTGQAVVTWIEGLASMIERYSLALSLPSLFGKVVDEGAFRALVDRVKTEIAELDDAEALKKWPRSVYRLTSFLREVDGHSHCSEPRRTVVTTALDMGDTVAPAESSGESQSAEAFLIEHNGMRLWRVPVPEIVAPLENESKSYQERVHEQIKRGEQFQVDGFVIDLRGNRGGSMWPMYHGILSLVGTGDVGAFFSLEKSNASSKRLHTVSIDETEHRLVRERFDEISSAHYRDRPNLIPGNLLDAPVAVWVDGATGSAGEITSLILRGRPNTTIIGVPTAGMATCNTTRRIPRDLHPLVSSQGTGGPVTIPEPEPWDIDVHITSGVCADRHHRASVRPLVVDHVVGDPSNAASWIEVTVRSLQALREVAA